jgi:hypothetical protein
VSAGYNTLMVDVDFAFAADPYALLHAPPLAQHGLLFHSEFFGDEHGTRGVTRRDATAFADRVACALVTRHSSLVTRARASSRTRGENAPRTRHAHA